MSGSADPPATADVTDLLARAQEAHAAATVALSAAEDAARALGADVAARELTVERLRIVEPDGTVRLLVGGSSVAGVASLRGTEVPHPGRDPMAGLLFLRR